MAFSRKLKLMAIGAAIAACMAVAAPSASATNIISVVRDNPEANCPAVQIFFGPPRVVTGGCYVHMEGEATLTLHLFGVEGVAEICHVEIESRLNNNFSGYITNFTPTAGAHGAGCGAESITICNDAQAAMANRFPWQATAERDADSVVRLHADVCVFATGSPICEGELVVNVSETENSPTAGFEKQHYEVSDQRIGASSFCELTTDIESESNPDTTAGHERVHVRQ
jgi:hypothetical protein